GLCVVFLHPWRYPTTRWRRRSCVWDPSRASAVQIGCRVGSIPGSCSFILLFIRRILALLHRNPELFHRPITEIDQLAAFGTERPVAVLGRPRHLCAAARAVHEARLGHGFTDCRKSARTRRPPRIPVCRKCRSERTV